MLSTKERSSTSQEAGSVHSSVYPPPNMSHEVSASYAIPPLKHLLLTGDNLDKIILARVSPHEHLWTYFKPLSDTWARSPSTAELWLAAGSRSPKLLQRGGVLQEGEPQLERHSQSIYCIFCVNGKEPSVRLVWVISKATLIGSRCQRTVVCPRALASQTSFFFSKSIFE